VGDYEDSNKEIFYCTQCIGEKNMLYPRANYDASDADQWLQCRVCASILNKNDLIHTGKLQGFTIPSDNRYQDSKNLIVSVYDHDKPKNRKIERWKKEIDSIEDKDEREEKKRIGFIKFVGDSITDY